MLPSATLLLEVRFLGIFPPFPKCNMLHLGKGDTERVGIFAAQRDKKAANKPEQFSTGAAIRRDKGKCLGDPTRIDRKVWRSLEIAPY